MTQFIILLIQKWQRAWYYRNRSLHDTADMINKTPEINWLIRNYNKYSITDTSWKNNLRGSFYKIQKHMKKEYVQKEAIF